MSVTNKAPCRESGTNCANERRNDSYESKPRAIPDHIRQYPPKDGIPPH